MYKTYILGNGGYAQECFEQFVLGRVIEDFGGFIILKEGKAVLIDDEGINDFTYPKESAFVLGTGHRKWRKVFLEHLFKYYDQNVNHFPNIVANEAHLSQTSRIGIGNVLNCFAMTNANADIGNFNLLNCYASVHHDVRMGSHNIFTTYATVLGYCNVGDDNWFGNAVTVTSKTTLGNDNTLSSGEHLFEDMGDRQFFKHGIITEKPEKR